MRRGRRTMPMSSSSAAPISRPPARRGPGSPRPPGSDSGGGISPDKIAIPSWQKISGVINSSNKGSTTYRNGPDVSANANFTFYICADQTTCLANEYGGTSFAAPMWAGSSRSSTSRLAAMANPGIGFINPTIYPQNVTFQLRHGLPRHHQRQIRQLLGGDQVRSGDRMGQPQGRADHHAGALVLSAIEQNKRGLDIFAVRGPSVAIVQQRKSRPTTINLILSEPFTEEGRTYLLSAPFSMFD